MEGTSYSIITMLMQAERASDPLGLPVSSFCNIFWTSPTVQRMSGGMCAQFHVMEVYIDLVTMKLTCDSSFKTTAHASLYLPRKNYSCMIMCYYLREYSHFSQENTKCHSYYISYLYCSFTWCLQVYIQLHKPLQSNFDHTSNFLP